MQLNETKIDTNKLYFHGSSEAKVDQLDAPSYQHPFYVTTDLHYAMAFCTKSSSNTGDYSIEKTFTPSSQNYVYVVTLKPDCKVFDFRDHSTAEFKKFYKIIDKPIIDWIESSSIKYAHNDIYEFIGALQEEILKPIETCKNYLDYTHNYAKSPRLMTPALFSNASKMIQKLELQDAYKLYDIHQIMAPILKELSKLGFQGILTFESDYNTDTNELHTIPAKMTTNYAIGIFDVSGLDIIGLVPMRYSWLKKINPDNQQNKTTSTAEQKIKRFIQLYKKISSVNESVVSRIQFIYDVPEYKFKDIVSNSQTLNKHFNITQFEKLYGQDYSWCILLDNGKCVAAAALLKDFGPVKGMTYVNELQSLVSSGGYGKKMLMMLQKHYENIWLMADASVKSDVLLRFYRDPVFKFVEHMLPAKHSIYDVDTYVFAPNLDIDESQWNKFLKQYFGNDEALKSLEENDSDACNIDINNVNENKATYITKFKDEPDVDSIVSKFWEIRHRLNAPQNDIDWWIKKPFNELKKFVLGFDMRNKRERRDLNYRVEAMNNDAKLLGEKDGYEIWYVPTYEAMRILGRFYKGVSTEWCVASDDPSFWFDMYDESEFIVLVRKNLEHDEFDKVAIEMQNGGNYFNVDDFLMWDVENEDDRFCNDELMHYAWQLFKHNGERRQGL